MTQHINFSLLWNRFSQEEREIIVRVFQLLDGDMQPMHMGLLPFVKAWDVYHRLAWAANASSDILADVPNERLRGLAHYIHAILCTRMEDIGRAKLSKPHTSPKHEW